jgi:hypothetical protein
LPVQWDPLLNPERAHSEILRAEPAPLRIGEPSRQRSSRLLCAESVQTVA